MNYTLSSFQSAIVNHVSTSIKNLVLAALAGCGKTFTLVLALNEYLKANPNKQALMLAFNKSIVEELKTKVDDTRAYIATTHAVGFSILRTWFTRNYGRNVSLVLNDKFLFWDIVKNIGDYSTILTEENEKKDIFDFAKNVDALYRFCRQNLLQANEVEEIRNLAELHGIIEIADEIKATRKLLLNAYDLNETRIKSNVVDPRNRRIIHKKAIIIDYVDQLAWAAMHPTWCPKYDIVMIDECQDLNKAQHQLVFNSVKKGGKFVAVGDEHQAINGFAGAMNDSFKQLTEHDNTEVLPLSVNYRCGKNIIELAQSIVPQIEAHESAIDGKVDYVTSLKGIQGGDFILCRSKAPLIRVALKLLKVGITPHVLGSEILNNLTELIYKVMGGNKCGQLSTSLLSEKLSEYYLTTCEECKNKGYDVESSQFIDELKDKIECITIVADTTLTIKECIEKFKELFSEDNKRNAVKLMTAHKSKGLESDNVYILLPNKLPLVWRDQLPWQYEQEMNLKYVAFTRAKKNLNIVNVPEDKLSDIEIL